MNFSKIITLMSLIITSLTGCNSTAPNQFYDSSTGLSIQYSPDARLLGTEISDNGRHKHWTNMDYSFFLNNLDNESQLNTLSKNSYLAMLSVYDYGNTNNKCFNENESEKITIDNVNGFKNTKIYDERPFLGFYYTNYCFLVTKGVEQTKKVELRIIERDSLRSSSNTIASSIHFKKPTYELSKSYLINKP